MVYSCFKHITVISQAWINRKSFIGGPNIPSIQGTGTAPSQRLALAGWDDLRPRPKDSDFDRYISSMAGKIQNFWCFLPYFQWISEDIHELSEAFFLNVPLHQVWENMNDWKMGADQVIQTSSKVVILAMDKRNPFSMSKSSATHNLIGGEFSR